MEELNLLPGGGNEASLGFWWKNTKSPVNAGEPRHGWSRGPLGAQGGGMPVSSIPAPLLAGPGWLSSSLLGTYCQETLSM